MDCHYHPGRESISACTICGKPLCAECSMEIAGKTYCKDCLEQIIGKSEPQMVATPTPSQNPISETLQGMDSQYNEYDYYERETPYNEQPQTREQIIGDVLSNENTQQNPNNSPYSLNNFENPMSNQGYNNPYVPQNNFEPEPQYYQEPANQYIEPQAPVNNMQQRVEDNYYQPPEPQYYQEPSPQQDFDDGYIYPDHTYQPPENPNLSVENKYESYLNDLYVDDNAPLSQQIAKDEEIYGSLTRNPYESREQYTVTEQRYEIPNQGYDPYMPPNTEQPQQGFLNIDNVQHNNPQGDYIPQVPPAPKGGIRRNKKSKKQKNVVNDGMTPNTRSIHNIRNMETEEEPYGAVDIVLTIILVILILIVIFYIIYLFFLSSTYPTFLDAIIGLKDPGTFFGTLLGK